MNEYEFAAKHLNPFAVKGNEIVPLYCPFCGGGAHKDKYTFALNAANHTYNCKRGGCEEKGHFIQLLKAFGEQVEQIDTPPIKRSYIKPQKAVRAIDSSATDKYLKARGIEPKIAEIYGINENANGDIEFRFYKTYSDFERDNATFVKYRKPKKIPKGERKMWREKDTEPILFGMHLCSPETNNELILTEGEFDAVCCYQAVGTNCISVPSGCDDFTWIETCGNWLESFKSIIVFADNDAAGHRMVEALSFKVSSLIKVPDFAEYNGAKDANEILLKFGKGQLEKAIKSSKPIATKGLLNLSEVKAVDITEIPRALSGIHALDKATGGMLMGDLSVWTGKRGEGKSTVLTQVLIDAVDQGINVCAYSGEIPAERFKYIINLQAAGDAFVKEREDEKTGRIVQYVNKENIAKIENWYNGKFWLYDNKNIESDEAETILKIFETAYRRYDCRIFMVDNLMTVSACRNENDYYQMQADFTVKLRKLAEKLNVHIHLVVHPRKGEVKGSDDVGGLSTITNIACNVFGIKREEEKNESTLTCMKNRAYGENAAIPLIFSTKSRRYTEYNGFQKQYGWEN